MGKDLARQFIAALHAGRACLHPTDTLPGLTFDPTSVVGKDVVIALKGRGGDKPFLGLVASAAMARRFFAPLPGDWVRILDTLWPGPLSVVWTASPLAPRSMVAADGTIGLRVPQLPVTAAWFRQVLESVELPLPTTSVNRSGEPPLRAFGAAAELLASAEGSYIPVWNEAEVAAQVAAGAPSTVIRLHADGSFTVLREGALATEQLTLWARQVS